MDFAKFGPKFIVFPCFGRIWAGKSEIPAGYSQFEVNVIAAEQSLRSTLRDIILKPDHKDEGVEMPPDKICKTVHQYNKKPIPKEDMRKLLDIAEDYRKVKNYVYARFGGIGSLGKLYPGYTVQNEMTESGFRENLGLPSVYFYLAIFDALGDIKCQWTKTKTRLRQLINKNVDNASLLH